MGLFHWSTETPHIRAPWHTQSPDTSHKHVKMLLKVPAVLQTPDVRKQGFSQSALYSRNNVQNKDLIGQTLSSTCETTLILTKLIN